MTWLFRKSFSPPGVRITLSPSGISTSVGAGPFRATLGPRGPALTANGFGTGLSYQHRFSNSRKSTYDNLGEPSSAPPEQPSQPQLSDIKSAGSGELTTPGLIEFRTLLEQAKSEHGDIVRDLDLARHTESVSFARYTRWKSGWLLRRLFQSKFQSLQVEADEAAAKRAELEEQEQLSRLQTQIDIPPEVASTFSRLCDEFDILSKSDSIWDTTEQRNANRAAERTTATLRVSREPVSFKLDRCELIESEWRVPHLENANGGDIFFYPSFVLYFISTESFALLEYRDMQLSFSVTGFHEEQKIPPDATIVGHAWAKANKDGTPDMRFKDNYQIPIALYGNLTLTSETGMNEGYLISKARQAEVFF
jgi:hypothetical protein